MAELDDPTEDESPVEEAPLPEVPEDVGVEPLVSGDTGEPVDTEQAVEPLQTEAPVDEGH